MAQFQRRVWLLAVSLAVTFHITQAGSPIIRLNDQEGSILEGSNVTLECLSDEEGEDLSGFTFQRYSKWLKSWISLDQVNQLRCLFYDVTVNRDDGHLLLTIGNLQSWHTGLYRCVSSNANTVSANDSSSATNASFSRELDVQVEYLHGIFLTRSNTWCGTVGDSVTVLEGSDLELICSADASQTPDYQWQKEGDDWISMTNTLTITKASQEDSGTYTCQAWHPTLRQLTQSKSISVFVERSQRAFTLESVMSLSTPMLALAVALPAVLLLLVVLVIAILIPRHRAAAKKKAAPEESGQRTPIYKGSLESVPSVVADTHPLVM
ncbi:uncharacterized protein LOC128332601 [Hemicordylus capensis]|uniref:uncharacterized protein LOC128332601 n=1 Tax=Hemicordylus capensis TaxID=884348 RepID=UPI0023037018|nr:uncharacterized protein LOC128332601 [Hemicordylus capensis]XP_053123045.1 uncharacterized protein LOC128332601 [Hemicordylus capensis]XP_053123046.1 uncharacterized protein LOC128332601 [Hemicordylus capensis]XP_053123047.1 uncharacterized protein LOC128332601 [Hemicordylus capensis]XP_053123049.1 uncharacterized protein LOC128332601 [Hemicordylus capensis]XP_053123050.1 uncharacterized protein LOC128332601 [Hemicordylus capensis]XP_053123051.1 uncharacterized protein LOC128332601 [Hemico